MAATSPPKPIIKIRKATPEDADEVIDIFFDAFDGAVQRHSNPNGIHAAQKESTKNAFFPPPGVASRHGPSTSDKIELIQMVAEMFPADSAATGKGQIVAYAKWTHVKPPGADDDKHWHADEPLLTAENTAPGTNHKFFNECLSRFHRASRDLIGLQPCMHLDILLADPKVGRVGGGSALLKWGLDLADAEGVGAYLEASPKGYGLYVKYGFKPVSVVDIRLVEDWGYAEPKGDEPWGEDCAVEVGGVLAPGSVRTAVMMRPKKE